MIDVTVGEGLTALIGAVLYAVAREIVPKAKNGFRKNNSNDKPKFLTPEQHDKECDLKLALINSKLDDIKGMIEIRHPL